MAVLTKREIRLGREAIFHSSGKPRMVSFWRPEVILVFVDRQWLQRSLDAPDVIQRKLIALRKDKPRRSVQWVAVWPYRLRQVYHRTRWPGGFSWEDLNSSREYHRQRQKAIANDRS